MSWNKSSDYNNMHGATIKNLIDCYTVNDVSRDSTAIFVRVK